MVIFKKILDFYINSSLHVALSAFALVSMTQYFFGVEGDFSVAFFAFFGTVVGYNFVKYEAIARLNKTEIKKELKAIVFLSFISLLACFYFCQLVSLSFPLAYLFPLGLERCCCPSAPISRYWQELLSSVCCRRQHVVSASFSVLLFFVR